MLSIDGWIIFTIFIITYLFILFFERIQRTTAALCGAIIVMMFAMYRGIVHEEDAIVFIKFDIIVLLMSMMIIVNVLLETGFFGYVALKLAKMSKGNVGHLLLLLGLGTAFLSMIVDNVTTIILFIPITVEISKKLELNPIPFLISQAIMSNVGGVATMVGDPPNIIIASFAGFTFNDFLFHLFPVVILIGFIVVFLIRYTYKDWICSSGNCLDKFIDVIPEAEITDRVTMNKTLVILLFVFSFFVVHDSVGVSPAFVALTGAGATLLVNYYDPEKVLKHVEWSSLLFYSSLFIIVGVMEVEGIFLEFADNLISFAGEDELRATLLILWATGLLTSVVDRISTTVAMAPVIIHIGAVSTLSVEPLWWALAMGVGFGGNATPIGSAAGIVTVGLANKYNIDISLKEWVRVGIPAAMISLLLCTFVLIVFWGFYS